MDELIDILNNKGDYTGKTCLKSEAHAKGYFHPTIHVWLYTTNNKILLQKRAATKKVFPNLWDISVAGHIGAGEIIEDAAVREVNEEIGYTLSVSDLHKICVRKHQITHPNGIQDNEFHHVFIAKLTQSIETLTIQESEVSDLKLFDIKTILNTKDFDNLLLPEYQDYYNFVYRQIIDKIKL